MSLLLVAGLFQVLAATAASATEPVQVTVGMGGCRGSVTSSDYIANPYGEGFICTDALYTNGNLGKGWAELDLVPQRVTTSLGTQNNATTSYDLNFTVDYKNGAAIGYDFISPPSVNEALSDDSCTITSGAMQTTANQAERFITVHITQDKGTTCVFDWDARLALGSHLYPGSALHTHTRNENNGTQGVGNKDNSIPVPESFEAQDITKTMTATQDQQQEWLLSKEATPTDLNLGDSCDPGNTGEGSVEVTITWTKGDTVPAGQVAVHTEVTAINPSNRPIQVDVTDNIFSGTTLLDGPVTDGALVPAGTSQVVLTHDILIDEADAVNLNDIATAEYTDPVFPDVDIPGTTEATANATVVSSGTIINGTVDITDTESMTGNAEFSVADPGVGSFVGYTPGTFTTGPVDWELTGATDSGSVTFTKTVRGTGSGDVDATLSDEANLSVGGTPIVDAVTASTHITSTSLATLTINKTTSVPADGDLTFSFDVSQNGISVGTVNVVVPDGTTASVVPGTINLDDGTYQITETGTNDYPPAAIDDVVIGAGDCAAEITVDNTFGPATARVKKITVPEGSEAGWTFNLYLDDGDGIQDPAPAGDDLLKSTVTTTDADFISFPDALVDEGDYYVLEEEQHGWTSDGGDAGCTFTVDYPVDADGLFSCTFTNTKQTASASVAKVTDPAGNEPGWEFKLFLDNDPAGAGAEDTLISTAVTSGSGQTQFLDASNNPIELDEGDYYIVETPQAGWESDGGSADCTFTVEFPGSDGTTYECTFTNTARGTIKVTKTVTSGSNGPFTIELREGVDINDPLNPLDDVAGTVLDSQQVTAGGGAVQLDGDLEPGTYTVCEVVPGPGWIVKFDGSEGYTLVIALSNDRQCVDVEVTVANQDIEVAVENTPPPGGGQLTIGFWKNHASCKTSGGNQAPVLDQVLATFPIESGQTKPGFYVGTLYVDTCAEARNLLDKKPAGTVGKGKKAANDALINLAAQYVAAKLNIQGGAGTCAAINTAMASAKTLFEQTGFDGAAATPLTAAQKTLANSLAATIDQYNNGNLC